MLRFIRCVEIQMGCTVHVMISETGAYVEFGVLQATMRTEPEAIKHLTRLKGIAYCLDKQMAAKISSTFHQSEAIWLKASSDTNVIKLVIKDTKLNTSCV